MASVPDDLWTVDLWQEMRLGTHQITQFPRKIRLVDLWSTVKAFGDAVAPGQST